MKSASIRCPILIGLLALASACSHQETPARKSMTPANVRGNSVKLTRSVSISARVVADPATPAGDAAALTISEAGEDEPAEGPATFDVWPDGGFVIADPLRQRLVFFDPAGQFRGELQISFAAERVRVLPNNALSVVRTNTGERYIFESDSAGRYGVPRLASERDPDLDAIDAGVVTLLSGTQATVTGQPNPNTESPLVNVRFNAAGESMVSVRRLGADAHQRTYVAIEAASPGSRVDVRKVVRQYAPGGEQFVELLDIPLDYLVHPVDEFRIRDGVLYQLVPKSSEVRVNIWDTNSRP
ncbi:MAG TPA: hypothetical protein VKU19_30310 [Bryobacteraceae bacterium]|nr:hypothetical protein [Bryobacteraceae bacterium]